MHFVFLFLYLTIPLFGMQPKYTKKFDKPLRGFDFIENGKQLCVVTEGAAYILAADSLKEEKISRVSKNFGKLLAIHPTKYLIAQFGSEQAKIIIDAKNDTVKCAQSFSGGTYSSLMVNSLLVFDPQSESFATSMFSKLAGFGHNDYFFNSVAIVDSANGQIYKFFCGSQQESIEGRMEAIVYDKKAHKIVERGLINSELFIKEGHYGYVSSENNLMVIIQSLKHAPNSSFMPKNLVELQEMFMDDEYKKHFEKKTFFDDRSQITTLSWNNDGSKLVCGNASGDVFIFNRNGELQKKFTMEGEAEKKLYFSPNGSMIASIDSNNVILVDLQTYEKTKIENQYFGFFNSYNSLVWLSDQSIAYLDGSKLKEYNLVTRKQRIMEIETFGPSNLSFTGNSLAISGISSDTIEIYDLSQAFNQETIES